MSLSVEVLKQQVRERIDAFNRGDIARFAEFMAPASTSHFPGMPPLTRDQFLGLLSAFRSAFPDLKITLNSQVAEGDTVVTTWTFTGTQLGEMQGLPPSGKKVTMQGVTIDRFEGKAVIDHREFFDQLGMLQQLGAASAERR